MPLLNNTPFKRWLVGAVLAMVSSPSFDPNKLATHDTKASQAA